MSELVYVQELWRKRAEVAQECADELGELAEGLRGVVRRNYFGIGCEEGMGVFGRLSELVCAGAKALDEQAVSALELSRAAVRATVSLSGADAEAQANVE